MGDASMRGAVAGLAAVAGLCALIYGLALVWEPLAWIVGGALVAFVALVELAGPKRGSR